MGRCVWTRPAMAVVPPLCGVPALVGVPWRPRAFCEVTRGSDTSVATIAHTSEWRARHCYLEVLPWARCPTAALWRLQLSLETAVRSCEITHLQKNTAATGPRKPRINDKNIKQIRTNSCVSCRRISPQLSASMAAILLSFPLILLLTIITLLCSFVS